MTKCTALVLGAGGFIGSHMVRRLKREGYWVRGVDLKRPEFSSTEADEFIQGDLTDPLFVEKILRYTGPTGNFYKQDVPSKYWHPFHEIYQFAADMGGAGFIFTGENDSEIMHNSATINLNVLHEQKKLNNLLDRNYTKIFYSSSACMLHFIRKRQKILNYQRI
jgi:GDP-D-mannose 3',5'-epimerase